MSFREHVAAAARESLRVFGEAVTYTPTSEPAVAVTGIFSEQYLLATSNVIAAVEVTSPAVFLLLEDLPEDPRDEDIEPTLTIRGVDYRVTARPTDGMGGITLVLCAKT